MYTCIIIRWAGNITEAPKLRENNDNAKGVDGLLVYYTTKQVLSNAAYLYVRKRVNGI